MPLSHLTLTVSHLPASTSFFLSCLQPLGYQFIGRHDEYIGFGSRSDEPADFWLTQERPGTPAGAVHIAFPAPSKEAVNSFFICALKAGGKIHGEPKIRDHDSGYFSAAVMDFDGNSIEAVYRPDTATRSQAGGPTFKSVKSTSTVSHARSTKTETFVQTRAVHAIQDIPPSQVKSLYEQQSTFPTQPQSQRESNVTAKTIIGTLLGATAGAAIAYAMVKGDSSSKSRPPSPVSAPSPSQYIQQPQPPPQPQAQPISMSMPLPMLGLASATAPALLESPTYRALEAPPPARSTYTANDAISAYARSAASKSPRADTIYEETEYYSPADGPRGSVYSQETSGIRRSSNGSLYATRELPLRVIEYPQGSQKGRSQSYPCDPSTLISSYVETSPGQQGHIIGEAESEFSSISTIKPTKSAHSSSPAHRSSASYHSTSKSSSHHHHSANQHHSTVSHTSSQRSSKHHRSHAEEASSYSASRSAHKIPLPESKPGSVATYSIHSSTSTSKRSSKSHKDKDKDRESYAPHDIPLPESATPSTVFLDAVGNVDIDITPDDSISQVGVNNPNNSSDHKSSSGRSHRSKSGSSHSHAPSRRSSKFDEPVKPSDSISQVSSHHSRATDRTVKAGSKVHSTHSKSSSRSNHH